jgi:hypothetical protein
VKFIFVIIGVLVTAASVFLLLSSNVDASSSSWRYDAHGRNIDIDICVRCESPIPGPPGPPGPPGEQGPPGPSQQFTVRTIGVLETEIPSDTEKTAEVLCLSDETAISGSFGIIGNTDGIESLNEGLTDTNGYFIDIDNGGKDSIFVNVFVTCAKLV